MTGGGTPVHATGSARVHAGLALPEAVSGRARCVADVVRALQNGRGVLVLGAAGVGKSHLAEQCRRALGVMTAADHPAITARLSIPFEGLTLLLDLPERPVSDAEATRAVLSWAANRSPGPVLIWVEDAHLLDRGSAEVIARLTRRGDLLLLATARPIAGSMSPWHELWRDDVVDRLDLQDLSPADTEAMLSDALGGPVLPDSVRALWQETGGNAFHLHELVAAQRTAGTLERRDGVWTLTGDLVVDDRLLDLVRREVGTLSDDALLTLQGLALLGALTMSSLLDAVGLEPVNEVLRRGLIHATSAPEHPDVVLALAHPLLGHVLRRDMPAAVRRDILERAVGPGACLPLAPATVMLMLSEHIAIPVAKVRSAVAAARARFRPHDVVAIVDAALSPSGLIEASDLDIAALLIDRAYASHRIDEPESARTDLDEAFTRLRRAGEAGADTATLARLVVDLTQGRADLAQHHHDDVDAALAVLSAGRTWLESLPPYARSARHVLELDVARLTLLGYAGRHSQSLREAVRLLDENPEPHLALPLVCPTCLGLLQAGRFEDARRIVMRYQPLTTGSECHREAAGLLSAVSFFAHLWSGDVTNADGPAQPALDLSQGAIPWAGVHIGRGLIAAANGAWSPARRALHTANAAAADGYRSAGAPLGLALEALAAAACGDSRGARVLMSTVDRLPRGATAVFEGDLRLLRLDTLIWLREGAALAHARALVDWARAQSLARIELEALHRALVLRRWTGRPIEAQGLTRIQSLRSRVRSTRASALVRHAQALHRDDVDLVEIAERELNRRGLWLPPGRQALALTQREREIASLAKARLTSRVIAERLGLSARTVDSHLASVFTKLGVSSREDLSHALA